MRNFIEIEIPNEEELPDLSLTNEDRKILAESLKRGDAKGEILDPPEDKPKPEPVKRDNTILIIAVVVIIIIAVIMFFVNLKKSKENG